MNSNVSGHRDSLPAVVALASSAGGLEALSKVLSHLPADLDAAVVIVQHMAPKHRSHLSDILRRRTVLQVKEAEDDDKLHSGVVLIAPPDRHMVVNAQGTISLTKAALVHHVRPSADVLFASLAAGFKGKLIAVVLTGTGQDGAAGIATIKAAGGTVLAQDKSTSAFFGMPGAAIQSGNVDEVLPLQMIATRLVQLVAGETI